MLSAFVLWRYLHINFSQWSQCTPSFVKVLLVHSLICHSALTTFIHFLQLFSEGIHSFFTVPWGHSFFCNSVLNESIYLSLLSKGIHSFVTVAWIHSFIFCPEGLSLYFYLSLFPFHQSQITCFKQWKNSFLISCGPTGNTGYGNLQWSSYVLSHADARHRTNINIFRETLISEVYVFICVFTISKFFHKCRALRWLRTLFT